MTRVDLRFLTAHVLIPFATGAGLGALFLIGIYYLDVGGMCTMMTANGGSILDIGLVPFACAFGALAIGTNQAMGLLIDN
jgi:hypothetical protein